MLELLVKDVAPQWRAQGGLRDYQARQGGELLFELSTYVSYHATKWRTHLTGYEAYRELLGAMAKAGLSEARASVILQLDQLIVTDIPLQSVIAGTRGFELNLPELKLFRIEEGETALMLDRTLKKPYMGVISPFNDADIVAELLPRSLMAREPSAAQEIISFACPVYRQYESRRS